MVDEEQVAARVGEHLQAGEMFWAAVWAGRADARAAAGVTRTEMSPFRFRRIVPATGPSTAHGSAGSLALALDQHIRNITDPRVLALTDRRLLVLAKRRSLGDVLRLGSGPLPPLELLWECPRADFATASEKGGKLRLTFGDRSDITLLTPSAGVKPFLAAV